MCTAKVKKNSSKDNKPWNIAYGFFRNMFMHIFMLLRILVEWILDILFAFYWEDRMEIPALTKVHYMLKESAVSLAAKIRRGDLKSEALVQACIERIKLVNPVVNAITDERFEDALKEAREVDIKIASGLPMEYFKDKPFLGVPFTTKDSIAVAGMLHTLGLVARRRVRAEEDADCVRRLKDAGAICVALTNVPEVNKWQETRNMVFGQTNNPYHTGRTTGGSSGGEAALNAAMATPISLCSDIGGSTRMPAFYCGLFALNPTSGSTNLKGVALRGGGAPSIASVGFLSRHVEDLAPLTRLVAPRIDLDRRVDITKVRYHFVGVVRDLRVSPVRYELRMLMERVVDGLLRLAPFTERVPSMYYHPSFDYMYSLWRHAMTREADSFPLLLGDRRGAPSALKELAKKLVGRSQYTIASILKLIDEQLLPKVNKKWAEETTEKLRNDLIELLGDDSVLLFPSAPQPAPYHYGLLLRPFNFSYWALFNALRLPAAQVPLGLSRSGLPIGIQVVAGPGHEALCLAVAQQLKDMFTTYLPPCAVSEY